MQTTFTQIMTRYNSANADAVALRAAVTGMWAQVAPPLTVRPYITFHAVGGDATYVMGPSIKVEMRRIQFSIWIDVSSTPTTTATVMDLLKKCYDLYCVNVSSYGVLEFWRTFENILDDPDKGWQGVVLYEVRRLNA